KPSSSARTARSTVVEIASASDSPLRVRERSSREMRISESPGPAYRLRVEQGDRRGVADAGDDLLGELPEFDVPLARQGLKHGERLVLAAFAFGHDDPDRDVDGG